MCPVDEAAQVVPLEETAEPDAVAERDGNSLGHLGIVRDQQGLTARDPDHEALVALVVAFVRQQADDDAGVLDPAPGIRPGVAIADRQSIRP